MVTRTSDVAGTVHEVVAAFDKAVKLVQRVADRKDDKNDPEGIQSLFESLSLGSVIVKGYFEADSKKFGPSYAIGDHQAQIELRDVLLGLKSLVSDLQDVLLDDKDTDLGVLQDTSDTCRSNAGICLGQLHQRLAAETRNQMRTYPQSPSMHSVGGLTPTSNSGIGYSTSRSTNSSSRTGRFPLTPDQYAQERNLSLQWPPRRPESDEQYYTHPQRRGTAESLQSSYRSWVHTSQSLGQRDADEISLRRPSSHCLTAEDGALLSPGPAFDRQQTAQALPGRQGLDRDSYASFDSQSGAHSGVGQPNHTSQTERERYGPDSFSSVQIEPHRPYPPDRDSTASVTSYAQRMQDGIHSNREFQLGQSLRPDLLRVEPLHQTRRQSGGERQELPASHSMSVRPATSGQGPPASGPAFQPSEYLQRVLSSEGNQQIPLQPHDYQTQPHFFPSPPNHTMSHDRTSVLPYPTFSREDFGQPLQQRFEQSHQQSLHPPAQLVSQGSPRTHSLSMSQVPYPSPKASSITSVAISASLPLTLPTDKNTLPFCKGAFRLQIGLTKKAFISCNRPVGVSLMKPYWRCDKCSFEGPMHSAPGPPDKKGRPGKPEKIFDPKIRECGPLSTAVVGPDGRGEGSGGVRYKWAFLAKCHVPLKTVPQDQPQGTFGSYGCIFCTAEGVARGWTGPNSRLSLGMNGPGLNDAGSVLSGGSGHSSGSGTTPVFGTVELFMDHLQMHRCEDNWPCAEMLTRMKCIVGRAADSSEDWDVNFLPL